MDWVFLWLQDNEPYVVNQGYGPYHRHDLMGALYRERPCDNWNGHTVVKRQKAPSLAEAIRSSPYMFGRWNYQANHWNAYRAPDGGPGEERLMAQGYGHGQRGVSEHYK